MRAPQHTTRTAAMCRCRCHCRGFCLASLVFIGFICVGLWIGVGMDPQHCRDGGGDSPWSNYYRPPRSNLTLLDCNSFYVPMRDGVRIAVDVCLPSDYDSKAEPPLPAIFHQTRYFRSQWLTFFSGLYSFRHHFHYPFCRPYMVQRGYAWIDVDVRGTGASFGSRTTAFAPEEVEDSRELLDWVVAQPWSNGDVITFGVSYDGIAAEIAASLEHPNVRGTTLLFSPFDLYTEYAVPGGIQLSWFTRVWGSINDMLDSNNMQRILSLPDWTKKILRISVTPVDSSAEGLRVLDAAVDAHRDNWDVHAAASRVFAHGDIPSSIPRGIAEVSPFAHFNGLAAAAKKGMAVLGASGWLDGANANAAIKRFRALKALGVPDEHNIMFLGGFQHAGAYRMTADGFAVETCFDNPRNMLRYFDSLLFDSEGNPVYPDAHKEFTSEQPVHYFTVGADRWNHADTFPPAGIKTLPLLLSSDGALAPAAVVDSVAEADVAAAAAAAVAAAGAPSTGRGVDEVPFARLGTGSVTRWNSLVFAEKASVYKPTYPFAPVRQLEYTTAPLPAALEVTGYPVLDVHVSFSCPQAALYAYIEDVWPSGKATYVGEGQLNASFPGYTTVQEQAAQDKATEAAGEAAGTPLPALFGGGVPDLPYRNFSRNSIVPVSPGEVMHLRFALLPLSYEFKANHSIRLSFRLNDIDLFRESCGARTAHGLPCAPKSVLPTKGQEQTESCEDPALTSGAVPADAEPVVAAGSSDGSEPDDSASTVEAAVQVDGSVVQQPGEVEPASEELGPHTNTASVFWGSHSSQVFLSRLELPIME